MRTGVGTCALLACVVAALAVRGASARTATVFCAGKQLAGTFAVIPGSAGAGNIVYRLTLRNRSQATCRVTGLPVVRLVGAGGKWLPTHPRPAFAGGGTAVLVTLAPGRAATATARFSPDVPGPGEGGPQCEPKAYRLRVGARGGGTTVVPIKPPTPVCEHGQLQLTTYTRAR
jgi:hypothetical protein